jgi:CRP/FNR family transcriptional regulator, dissimilatory nitrate respiration regulator
MDYSILTRAPLFLSLSEEDIRNLLTAVPYRIRKFKADTIIAHTGDEVNSLMIVIEGKVKGEMVDYTGRIIKIEDIPAPGTIASAFVFGSRNKFPVNVHAISDTKMLIIAKYDFLKLLMGNDRILLNFLNMISDRSQFLSDKIIFLNFKTIKGKLAQLILQKAGNERVNITLDMTQTDLADYFGVARPSIARALGEMEEEGLIEAKGKTIRIIDNNRLGMLTTF